MGKNKYDIIYDLQWNFDADVIGEVLHVHPIEALQCDVCVETQYGMGNDNDKFMYAPK